MVVKGGGQGVRWAGGWWQEDMSWEEEAEAMQTSRRKGSSVAGC